MLPAREQRSGHFYSTSATPISLSPAIFRSCWFTWSMEEVLEKEKNGRLEDEDEGI
ncbi:hypothetical protein SLEP1_g34898 [Rubroshorea leprosula]|uniref:Uncharacterized protein n=1 Tax=Rubroshorea leprosula TaxID=152421 RepID=A0AAV5KLR3_9ROSI|nr:hypothetical protein SLEP1_g34898 [Rubroshorea leprosula]